MRPVHRKIIDTLKSREDRELGQCWLASDPGHAALIIPTFNGGYAHWRTFRRSTIQEALTAGLITLSRERELLPEFDCAHDPWMYFTHGLRIGLPEGVDQ